MSLLSILLQADTVATAADAVTKKRRNFALVPVDARWCPDDTITDMFCIDGVCICRTTDGN
jgi:hypothetical protein